MFEDLHKELAIGGDMPKDAETVIKLQEYVVRFPPGTDFCGCCLRPNPNEVREGFLYESMTVVTECCGASTATKLETIEILDTVREGLTESE